MFGIETLSGPLHAAALVGLVLAEALVLYVGYGLLSAVATATVLDDLEGD